MTAALAQLQTMVHLMTEANNDHFGLLGINIEWIKQGDVCMSIMPEPHLIGSIKHNQLAGGVITALLDSCAGMCATSVQNPLGIAPTIDLRIDYLGSNVDDNPVYAETKVYRVSRHVIFVEGIAYQYKHKPIAKMLATFSNMPLPDSMGKLIQQLPAIAASKSKHNPQAKPESSIDNHGLTAQEQLTALNCAHQQQDLQATVDAIPYAKALGIQAKQGQYWLPASNHLIGNPSLPALHGGAIGGFLEMSGLAFIALKQQNAVYPKVVNFAIDFLRPGRMTDTLAKCRLSRQGSKMAHIDLQAIQNDKTIARARMQVLLD